MRGYIIKKQETSSFSPALVKILNGDFMLPARRCFVACARSRRGTRACVAPARAHTLGFPLACSAAAATHAYTHSSHVYRDRVTHLRLRKKARASIRANFRSFVRRRLSFYALLYNVNSRVDGLLWLMSYIVDSTTHQLLRYMITEMYVDWNLEI